MNHKKADFLKNYHEVAAMLAGVPIFTNLSPEYLKVLEEITQEISLAKGALLFAPGDPSRGFYVVRDGVIRIYGRSPQGKEITQEIAGQGSAFALASPFAGTYHCFAEALKDSRLFLIKRQGFLDLVTGDKGFAIEWMRLLSLMVINLRRRLVDLTLTTPKARIASYLLLLAEMQDSQSITLPVPRKDLANFLGMTHETFYRTAKELDNTGLVRFTGQSVDLLDLDRLTTMTE